MANIPVDKESIQNFCSRWCISELSIFGSVLREDFHVINDNYFFPLTTIRIPVCHNL